LGERSAADGFTGLRGVPIAGSHTLQLLVAQRGLGVSRAPAFDTRLMVGHGVAQLLRGSLGEDVKPAPGPAFPSSSRDASVP
jgi:hypothetical protein